MKIDLNEFLLFLPVLAMVLVAIGGVLTWLSGHREKAWLQRVRRQCPDCGRVYRADTKRNFSICPDCLTHHRRKD